MKKRILKRILLTLILLIVLIPSLVVAVLYHKQDEIVQELVTTLNKDFKGHFKIADSHISLFENLPYISIDLDNMQLYEDKTDSKSPIVNIRDVYIGFDLITLLKGKVDIRAIKLKNGELRVVQSSDGVLNLLTALEQTHPIEDTGEELHMHLRSVEFENIDLTKINEANKITVEAFINKAHSSFRAAAEHLSMYLDSRFVLNVIKDNDTTFFKHKHVNFDTRIDYDQIRQLLSFTSSTLMIEQVMLGFEGSVGMKDDLRLDLKLNGKKPNFELLIAFAPEELVPALKKYDNKGIINFDARINGKLSADRMPHIEATFSCRDGFLENTDSHKRLDALNFTAHFTNGDSSGISTMAFSLTDFSSRPEAGTFSGHLKVKNFESPEIDTRIASDFDLDFLSKFLGIKDLQDLRGKVKLTMNFRDVIDLQRPEKAIEKLNESYFTELKVTGLGFRSDAFHLAFQDVDIDAVMEGHKALIRKFTFRSGKSDLSMSGSISDLPAIIHHTRDQVTAVLDIRSKVLDIRELTSGSKDSKPVDERISDLSMRFSFKSSARAFTESPNLPVGEFFIDDLYAKLQHYPHTLHDFHADLLIDPVDFRIIDFTGMIDKSDFHFSGKLRNYDLWFADTAKGDTRVDFDLTSNLLKLEDLFAYKGENYVPEDYRHEELRHLKLHGHALLHFKDSLHSSDIYLDQFTSHMKMHHYKFEKFKGRFHFEDRHLQVKDFQGKLGKSDFLVNMNYYLGKDNAIKKRDNFFSIRSPHLDLDELFSFKPASAGSATTPADHEKGFNIYEVPFTDMSFHLDIGHLNYHRYLINNLKGRIRSTTNHYIHLDTLSLDAADGHVDIKGYFNGSNPNEIYFSPDMRFKKIDIDKLLLKFENFGQDHLVSENVHGRVSGRLTGKIHLHRDMVPIINDSEIHMDIEVVDGKLEKYAPLTALGEYFKDKNVAKVLFDTLRNRIDMNNGEMSFPLMTINSSLGFLEVKGKQDMDGNMDYYFKIPMKLVTGVAKQKLFGSPKQEDIDPDQEDEIQYKDDNKRVKYVNLRMVSKGGNYDISLVKDKTIKNAGT